MINPQDLPRAIRCSNIVGQWIAENGGLWPDRPRNVSILDFEFRKERREQDKPAQILTVWHIGNHQGYDILAFHSTDWIPTSPIHIAVVIDDVLCTAVTDRNRQAYKVISFSHSQESGAEEFITAVKNAVMERALLD